MTAFSKILAAADGLSVDEQVILLEMLRRRIAERNRAELVRDVAEAHAESSSGRARPASAKEIVDEARGET